MLRKRILNSLRKTKLLTNIDDHDLVYFGKLHRILKIIYLLSLAVTAFFYD